jgi:hypothetical protein
LAIIGAVNIGVAADTAPLKSDLGQAAASVQSFGSQIGSLGTVIKGAFAAAIGGAAVAGVMKLAGAAAHATEAANKIEAVFGKQSDEVMKSSRAMADAYGISITEILDKQGQLGSLFSGAGFNANATAKFSQTFASLANDLSRFNDTSFEVAFEKLRAGLSGESEPLKQFGILLNEDAVKAKALELGLAKAGQTLTETAKIQARANIILEKSGPAIGAAAREADGASAKMEAFHGRVENLTVALGETLAPVIGDALGGIGIAIVAMGDAWSAAKESVLSWAGTSVGAMEETSKVINLVEVSVGTLSNAWQVFMTAIKFGQGLVLGLFTAMIDGAAKVARAFDYVHESLTGVSTGIGEEATVLADSLKDSLAELRKEFFAEFKKPWASDAVSDTFAKAHERIKALRQDLVKTPLALPKDVGGKTVMDKAAKSPANPFGGAALFGSQEAASITLRSRYGDRRDGVADSAKKTANNTAQIVAQNREVVRALNNIGAVGVQKI